MEPSFSEFVITRPFIIRIAGLLAALLVGPIGGRAGEDGGLVAGEALVEESGGSMFPQGASLFLEAEGGSAYVFRGVNLGSGLFAGRADLVFPLGEVTTLALGGKYLTTDDHDEAQGFAALEHSMGWVRASLGYRFYGGDADDRQEVGLMLASTLAGIDFSLAYFFDSGLSGHYVELTGQHLWSLGEPVGLRATAGVAASADYWHGESGLNHALVRLDLPVALREWIVLTPWVGVTIPLDAIDGFADEEVAGGVSLRLSF
jgi:hypothetical protein